MILLNKNIFLFNYIIHTTIFPMSNNTYQKQNHRRHHHEKKHQFILNTMNQYALENTLYHNAILTLTNLRDDNITSIKSNTNSKSSSSSGKNLNLKNFVIHKNTHAPDNNNETMTSSIRLKPKDKWFYPKQNDALFWIFYIVQHGLSHYEFIKNDAFKVEKEWKIKEIEHVRKQKGLLKANKIKKTEVENQLINEKKIDLKTLEALCLLYKKNIVYIWGRKYIEFLHDPNDKIYVCETKQNKTRMYHEEYIETILETCRNKYWKIDNIKKPLKSFSAYLLPELQSICGKLNIEMFHSNGKKKTKKDLYQKILETM